MCAEMKDTIKCCISCILPCGSLDVIRVVHSNGRVEEISGKICAGEIMKAYPKHVLKRPTCSTSSSSDGDHGYGGVVVPKIAVVPPDEELQRGKIYFLIPVPSSAKPEGITSRSRSSSRKKTRRDYDRHRDSSGGGTASVMNLLVSDRYLSEILSEKLSVQRDRRRGRVGVWRPHLESISEFPSDV